MNCLLNSDELVSEIDIDVARVVTAWKFNPTDTKLLDRMHDIVQNFLDRKYAREKLWIMHPVRQTVIRNALEFENRRMEISDQKVRCIVANHYENKENYPKDRHWTHVTVNSVLSIDIVRLCDRTGPEQWAEEVVEDHFSKILLT